MFHMYNEKTRGIFTVSNYDKLNLSGAFTSSPDRKVFVVFARCKNHGKPEDCASDEEIDAFIDDNAFGFYMANNFINMEDVREEDDSLDFVIQEVWSGFINKSSPMVRVELNEI